MNDIDILGEFSERKPIKINTEDPTLLLKPHVPFKARFDSMQKHVGESDKGPVEITLNDLLYYINNLGNSRSMQKIERQLKEKKVKPIVEELLGEKFSVKQKDYNIKRSAYKDIKHKTKITKEYITIPDDIIENIFITYESFPFVTFILESILHGFNKHPVYQAYQTYEYIELPFGIGLYINLMVTDGHKVVKEQNRFEIFHEMFFNNDLYTFVRGTLDSLAHKLVNKYKLIPLYIHKSDIKILQKEYGKISLIKNIKTINKFLSYFYFHEIPLPDIRHKGKYYSFIEIFTLPELVYRYAIYKSEYTCVMQIPKDFEPKLNITKIERRENKTDIKKILGGK